MLEYASAPEDRWQASVGGYLVCKHASRGAAADDDIVELLARNRIRVHSFYWGACYGSGLDPLSAHTSCMAWFVSPNRGRRGRRRNRGASRSSLSRNNWNIHRRCYHLKTSLHRLVRTQHLYAHGQGIRLKARDIACIGSRASRCSQSSRNRAEERGKAQRANLKPSEGTHEQVGIASRAPASLTALLLRPTRLKKAQTMQNYKIIRLQLLTCPPRLA